MARLRGRYFRMRPRRHAKRFLQIRSDVPVTAEPDCAHARENGRNIGVTAVACQPTKKTAATP